MLNLETLSFSGDIKGFADDIEIAGDADFTGGRVDLNGRTLSVGGDLLHSGGELVINAGTLDVAGDYVIAGSVSENGAGEKEYTTGSGQLCMEQAADTVRVGGDFATNSSSFTVVEGKLYVGGDFSARSMGFNATGEHTVIFNGDAEQRIDFGRGSAHGFANVRFENPNICLASDIRGFTLQDDINLRISVEEVTVWNEGMDLNGHSLSKDGVLRLETLSFIGNIKGFGSDIEIAGDAKIKGGRVDLNGHTLSVGGDLLHSGGELVINGGTLEVGGDYVIAGSVSENSAGEKEYTTGSGQLCMEQAADTVRVGGDFATNSSSFTVVEGKLYVGGDFSARSMGFNATGEHTVIFNGDAEQRIDFGRGSAHGFANVRFENPNICLASDIRGFTLQDDINLRISVEEVTVWNEGMDLNGHSLSKDGVLRLETLSFIGNIKGFGSDIEIAGDAKIKGGRVDLNGHTLSVGGDLLHSGGELVINGGTLEVGGDYVIAGSVSENGAGEKEYGYGFGVLHMQYAGDTVRVGGDFITKNLLEYDEQQLSAGTIYLAGDFSSLDDYGHAPLFSASGEHTIVFNGSEEQHIYFEYAYYNGFAKVRFENPNICLDSDLSLIHI